MPNVKGNKLHKMSVSQNSLHGEIMYALLMERSELHERTEIQPFKLHFKQDKSGRTHECYLINPKKGPLVLDLRISAQKKIYIMIIPAEELLTLTYV